MTAVFENVSGDSFNMTFLPVATADSPCGIIPTNGRYNLMATLTDINNQSQVRNIDLFADMIDFYWFIDLVTIKALAQALDQNCSMARSLVSCVMN